MYKYQNILDFKLLRLTFVLEFLLFLTMVELEFVFYIFYFTLKLKEQLLNNMQENKGKI
jgi:hypothetical protein